MALKVLTTIMEAIGPRWLHETAPPTANCRPSDEYAMFNGTGSHDSCPSDRPIPLGDALEASSSPQKPKLSVAPPSASIPIIFPEQVPPGPSSTVASKYASLEFYPFTEDDMSVDCEWAEAVWSGSFSDGPLVCEGLVLKRHTIRPAIEQAYLLVQWLRRIAPDSIVPASQLVTLYPAFCDELRVQKQPWQTVAKYVKFFTGGRRKYGRIHGKNVRIYLVPADAPGPLRPRGLQLRLKPQEEWLTDA